uniref:TOBE domain-containing protein n=1 Tax=Blautia sp. TaxID=1955243 RepID=UPI003FEF8F04
EAINMSDRIVVMREGMLEQIGTPDEIYNHPKTAYVADFVGNANIIEGVVEEIGQEKIRVQIQGQRMEAEAAEGMKAGEKVKLAVRRENLQVCTEGENGLEAVVTDKSFQGGQLHVALQLKTGEELVASRYGMARIVPGQKVHAVWKPEHAVPVDGKQEAEA